MVQLLKTVVVSDKIMPINNKQPEMILTNEVLAKSPDVYVNAIHNENEDGLHYFMNFELSNGYVTKQTQFTTAHRHVIPVAVFTHTTQVLVHYWGGDWIYGSNIRGFRFLDA